MVEVRLGGFSVFRNMLLFKIEPQVRPETHGYHEFHAPFPTILHVSKEARTEAMSSFINLATKNTVGSAYFNPKVDVLCIRELHNGINDNYVKALNNFIDNIPHLDKIARVAFTNPHLHMGLNAIGHRLPMVVKFTGIKEAILLEKYPHSAAVSGTCACGGPEGKFMCFLKDPRGKFSDKQRRMSTESVKYFRRWLELGFGNKLWGTTGRGDWKEPVS
jgi:hypothetical protein